MSEGIFFLKKEKLFTCISIILVFLFCLTAIGVSYAQSSQEVEKIKSIQIINPHPPFSLRLWLDKGRGEVYAPREKIKIFFQVSRDSYVKIYNYDTKGRVKIIFPNRYTPNNFVRAGETRTIEGVIDPYTRPGVEYVQGFATTRPMFLDDREKELISKEIMPEVSKDFKNFTVTLKGIIVSLPPTTWTSSNVLSYTIRPMTPPVNYGRIMAISHPSGAKVYLDGRYRGTAPLSLERIASGKHSIKFIKSGYQEWSKNIYVYLSKTTTVSANLVTLPSYGAISISCNQGNAKIYLDGNYKKRTYSSKSVMLGNIEEGYHELSITKTGYENWNEKIYVSPSQTTNVFVNLVRSVEYGSISVYCNQGNAKIYLDGSYKKRTFANKSVELKNIEQGYHELLISKDGYQDWLNTIMVTDNQTYMVSVYLAPEINYNGSIAVYCNISGAKIFVNGTYKAVTSSSQPKILEELKEKEYEITLIKDGYRTWVEDTWVYAGKTTSLYVDMEEIEQ